MEGLENGGSIGQRALSIENSDWHTVGRCSINLGARIDEFSAEVGNVVEAGEAQPPALVAGPRGAVHGTESDGRAQDRYPWC